MQTKTLNRLISEKLVNIGYPIHYYMYLLHYAKVCLEEIYFDYNLGANIKEAKLTISENRATLPSDTVDIINVFGVVAGERRNFLRNNALVIIQNDGEPWSEESHLPSASEGTGWPLPVTKRVDYLNVVYPDDKVYYEYNTNGTEIVFGVNIDTDEVYLRYLSNGLSDSVANVVHPYLSPVVFAFIDWKLSELERRPQSESMRKQDLYYNEKRKLRGRLNPLSTSDLYQLLITN